MWRHHSITKWTHFFYLFILKLTHIENIFLFCNGCFWYFNKLGCANWIEKLLSHYCHMKTLILVSIIIYIFVYVKKSMLVFLSVGRESCWLRRVWIKPKLGCHFLCVTIWKGLHLMWRKKVDFALPQINTNRFLANNIQITASCLLASSLMWWQWPKQEACDVLNYCVWEVISSLDSYWFFCFGYHKKTLKWTISDNRQPLKLAINMQDKWRFLESQNHCSVLWLCSLKDSLSFIPYKVSHAY